MSAKKQLRRRSSEDEPRFVIGMDAHSKKLAISIWDWSDRFNPCLHQEIKCMDIESMVTTVEEPRRFSKGSKLAAYSGFSPVVNSSGEEEERAKKDGGLHKPLDGEGRQDVKFFFTEAGQSVLTSCTNSRLGKWGWSMINRGKPRNKGRRNCRLLRGARARTRPRYLRFHAAITSWQSFFTFPLDAIHTCDFFLPGWDSAVRVKGRGSAASEERGFAGVGEALYAARDRCRGRAG